MFVFVLSCLVVVCVDCGLFLRSLYLCLVFVNSVGCLLSLYGLACLSGNGYCYCCELLFVLLVCSVFLALVWIIVLVVFVSLLLFSFIRLINCLLVSLGWECLFGLLCYAVLLAWLFVFWSLLLWWFGFD